jgi:O-methyltransferase domain/Dimerisation domain
MLATNVQPDGILELGYAFRKAKVLLSAVELEIFTVLAEGPLDCDALQERIGIDPRGARDFFDALVALGLLERDGAGCYSNTPETHSYLDARKPSYIGGDLAHLNERMYRNWSELTAALRTGKPQNGLARPDYFPTLYANHVVLNAFVRGMTGGSLLAARAIAAKFPWRDYGTLIDIGTAEGCLPVEIARAHDHIRGGGFDLPQIRPYFEDYVGKHGLDERLSFHAGDFLSGPLPSADVLVMGRVLHNWDLATKKALLAKAYEALPCGGALVVYERLIDDGRRTSAAGLLASLNMLIVTAGGFDFTAADCTGWMREAGFRHTRVEPLVLGLSMIVATKP